MREGQRRKSERKFFPGYVLVQMEMDDETWHLVKEVPKVLGFIGGSSDKPAPITDNEAQAILNRVEEGVDKPRPKVLFEPGEVVRVTDGPFNDFSGVVEQRQLREEQGPGRGPDSRVGRRRWSWISARWKRADTIRRVRPMDPGAERETVWQRKSRSTSSCRFRPARRTRARRWARRSASPA